MKRLGFYYSGLIVFVGLLQLTYLGQRLFPPPKVNRLYFPSEEQVFTPAFPILNPGVQPLFPASEVILQERLYAPFVSLRETDLSNRNLSKAHLSFADLRGSKLLGTDLSQALLYGAQLEGAVFNKNTRLPFSYETALALGMKEQL
ncbi:pentapeptide repeat-containing protein [Bdellovibrio bacteriovorus]|uniref:pentapeptide repeat-containing protein n=1 Tax=Bdellovibrio bacteriovorus TaxID=959 RepID=UPI0035A674CF